MRENAHLMTRQRLHQLARNAKGLCAYCTSPLHPGSRSVCYYHLVKIRNRLRKANGCKPGHRTGLGRPAITRLPKPVNETQFQDAA